MTSSDVLDEAGLETVLRDRFGEGARVSAEFGNRTVDVPSGSWVEAVTWARDELGLTFFDWLTAVDEGDEGFDVVCCLWRLGGVEGTTRLLLRTRLSREAASLPSVTGVFAGAGWAERETWEMFGIDFPGHPNLETLLLPEGFEGNPLRKEFVLVARAAKPWPGAKEPGEPDPSAAPVDNPRGNRRRNVAPGVPGPEWRQPG